MPGDKQLIIQITANEYWVLGLAADGKVYKWNKHVPEWQLHKG